MSDSVPRHGRSRRLASILLGIAGSLLLALGGVLLYLREEVVDSHRFADNATRALDHPQVRLALAQPITDAVLDNGPRRLINARPLIESAVIGALGSPPVKAAFHEAADSAMSRLVDRRPQGLLINITDAALVAADAVSALAPDVGRRLPDAIDRTTIELFESEVAVHTVAAAGDIRALGLALPPLGLLLLIGSVALAPDRRRTLTRSAVMAAVPLVVLLAALLGARAAVVNGFDSAVVGDAAGATWDALLGGLGDWLLIGAALLLILAAAARFGEEPADLLAPARRSIQALARRPESTALGLLRALAIIALGLAMLLAPHLAIAVLAVLAGAWALYVGVLELLAIVTPAGAAPRSTGRSRRRPALALAGVPAAVVVVAILVGGGEEEIARPAGPPPACNGYQELCDRRIDQVTLAATHNSMSAAAEPGWYAPNQRWGIRRQLDGGIRGLLIDTHYGTERDEGRGFGRVVTDLSREDKTRGEIVDQIGTEAAERVEGLVDELAFDGVRGESEPYLCHVLCELGATRLGVALGWIRSWLERHPDEFLVIVVEDVVSPQETVEAFEQAGLTRWAWAPATGEVPPTLGELIAEDKRLLVMAERHGGGSVGATWYVNGYRDLLQETPFHFESAAELDPPQGCRPNRGNSANPMLLVNNWVEKIPRDPDANARVNEHDVLLRRVRACARLRGMQPNLIAVDNYDLGDVLGVAREMNGLPADATPSVRELE